MDTGARRVDDALVIQLVTPASEVTVTRVADRVEVSTFNMQSTCWCKVLLTPNEAMQLGQVLIQAGLEKVK